jgi:AGZA family xanthine/uracil permease-like MFS transporter
MPGLPSTPSSRYRWAAAGDLNAFFGLTLDNLANLVLAVSLLASEFQFPESFALGYMVPGTALGVLVGDLAFSWMAFRLARRTGRSDVTAMPLGLDTPSVFGMVFFVLGPAFLDAKERGMAPDEAARIAWHIGICALFASGLFKLACSLGSGWVRRMVPRAGLLGSLAAIAIVLISFLPLLDILRHPVVGLVALTVILATLIARIEAPARVPGALAALAVGGALYYGMRFLGWIDVPDAPVRSIEWLPTGWLSAWSFGWLDQMGESLRYLPVVIPFALATVVGGIDCTESAAAGGDEYHTGRVIAVEGVATLVAAMCGGVIQTTPYIGHPAYTAMGARAAYTLATALVIASAGLVGYFGLLFDAIPRPAIYPILIFVGLEIAAQSFRATPQRHYPAVALACVPAMAYLVTLFTGSLAPLVPAGVDLAKERPVLAEQLPTLHFLSGGFILTSLLWAATLALLIDRRMLAAATCLLVAAGASAFGVIHSPLPGSPLVVPWNLEGISAEMADRSPLVWAGAYALTAAMLAAWHWWNGGRGRELAGTSET